MTRAISIAVFFAVLASAQTTTPRRTFVRATGEGVVSIKPDQMKLTVSVITQADTADQAAQDNATRAAAVISAVQKILGAGGDVRTIGYSVYPNYRQGTGGSSVISGYTASNTIEATTGDLSIPGRIIDTAVQAGASTIGGLSFGLKDPQPAHAAALRLATQTAQANATSIASGLNLHVGSVISAQEASAVQPVAVAGFAAASTTPILTGMVESRASVVLEVELIP
jgi:uncharacterized protein